MLQVAFVLQCWAALVASQYQHQQVSGSWGPQTLSAACDCGSCSNRLAASCCALCLAPERVRALPPFFAVAFGQEATEGGDDDLAAAAAAKVTLTAAAGATPDQAESKTVAVAGLQETDDLAGCQCCLNGLLRRSAGERVSVFSGSSSPPLFFDACCAVCLLRPAGQASDTALGLRPAGQASDTALGLRAVLLRLLRSLASTQRWPDGRRGIIARDDGLEEGAAGASLARSVAKRSFSMECMCCANSGITPCCSKCKIF